MATSRHVRKLLPLHSLSRKFDRPYSAAAATLTMEELDYWEFPLPLLQDTHGQGRGRGPQWVFLGSPGVGKSTYASRLSKILNVPHISMGNLLRKEASMSTAFAKELATLMRQGKLVPDDVIFDILSRRLEQKIEFEGSGFIFDGFPRNIKQAEVLDQVAEIDLVVNMKLSEDTLARHMGTCICAECGSNLGDAKEHGEYCTKCKAIAPADAASLVGRVNLLRDRQRVYSTLCKPVEQYYRKQRKLLDFEVVGGIPQTWPRLLSALHLDDNGTIMQQQLPM